MGNCKYGIYETQTEYLGKWYNNINSSNKSKVIDLFSWATTGLDKSRKPEYLWNGNNERYGGLFPTAEGTQVNCQIYDVVNQYDRMYDFGYAYMQNGRSADDNGDYRIPTQDQLKQLFDGSMGCFFQGCTVKVDGNDVLGTIVIPNVTTVNEVKDLINSIDGASFSSTYLKKITIQYGNEYSHKAITLNDYSLIKKMNNAIFFPAAGHVTYSVGSVTSGQGHYWSGNASSIYSSQRNAYGFYHTDKQFKYDDSQGAYIKAAVRLLVEVKE